MTEPRLSIVIPTFNRKRFVTGLVRSLLAEGLPFLEIVVVDDGSTDGTARVLEGFPIRVIRLKGNHGPSVARNRGARLATGHYLYFIDSDDLIVPGSLARGLQWLVERPDKPMVAGRIAGLVDATGTPVVLEGADWGLGVSRPPELTLEDYMAGRRFPCSLAQWILRRDFFLSLGGLDESLRLAEDMDFLLRALARGPVPTLDLPLFYYRIHGDNSTVWLEQARLFFDKKAIAAGVAVQLAHGIREVRLRWRQVGRRGEIKPPPAGEDTP